MKTFKKLITETSLWKFLYGKYKGEFYRGVSKKGTGVGLGALGVGATRSAPGASGDPLRDRWRRAPTPTLSGHLRGTS